MSFSSCIKKKMVLLPVFIIFFLGIIVHFSPTTKETKASDLIPLVINEIDYEQIGTDTAEFIELFNGSSFAVSLLGYTVELVNGDGAVVYKTIVLPDQQIASNGYFVLCSNSTTVQSCDLDVSPDTNLIQNGAPDAVTLLKTGSIVDTVSYEGSVAPPYTEGTGISLGDPADQILLSLSRFPNGLDTNNNNADFGLYCSSPGRANTQQTSQCDNTPSSTASVSPFETSTITTPTVTQISSSETPFYNTGTPFETITDTPTNTVTLSSTATNTDTATSSYTVSSTHTVTSIITETQTNTVTVSFTATNTYTPTYTKTNTYTPTNTVTASITAILTKTRTPSSTNTSTLVSQTATPTNIKTVISTITPTHRSSGGGGSSVTTKRISNDRLQIPSKNFDSLGNGNSITLQRRGIELQTIRPLYTANQFPQPLSDSKENSTILFSATLQCDQPSSSLTIGVTDSKGIIITQKKISEQVNLVDSTIEDTTYSLSTSLDGTQAYYLFLEEAESRSTTLTCTTRYTQESSVSHFEAEWVDQTVEDDPDGVLVVLEGDQERSITVHFRNTGNTIWYNDEVGVYVQTDLDATEPIALRNSLHPMFGKELFATELWGTSYDKTVQNSRATWLQEQSVEPGSLGTFLLTFKYNAEFTNLVPDAVALRRDFALAYRSEWIANIQNGSPSKRAWIWVPVQVEK